jgi:transcription elongation factor SPT5
MTDAITVKSVAKADMTIGSWVRVQNGIYKGDLAQLHDFDSAGTAYVIKVVPRIDYAELLKRCGFLKSWLIAWISH